MRATYYTRTETNFHLGSSISSVSKCNREKSDERYKRNGNEQRAISEIKAPRDIRVMDQIGNERRRWLHRVWLAAAERVPMKIDTDTGKAGYIGFENTSAENSDGTARPAAC